VIDEIRRRERNGAVELPKRAMRVGDRVRILAGPFHGHFALYAGMSGFERVTVLLQLFSQSTRVVLAERDVAVIN
jgi:transcription antitermination factor NusG